LNPVWPMAFGPHADLLLPVSFGPAGPAGLPGGHLLPCVKAVIELHSAPPPHRAAMAATPSPVPPLFMADRYHTLILAIITIYSLYSLPPLIPATGHY
jgi:hypothetical protein